MRAVGVVTFMISIGLLVAGLMSPRYLRSSLFDRAPTYDRAATDEQETEWSSMRQRYVAGAERFRRFGLWVGVPLLVLGLAAFIAG